MKTTVLHKPYCSQTIVIINDPFVFRFSSLFKKKQLFFIKVETIHSYGDIIMFTRVNLTFQLNNEYFIFYFWYDNYTRQEDVRNTTFSKFFRYLFIFELNCNIPLKIILKATPKIYRSDCCILTKFQIVIELSSLVDNPVY